MTSDYSFGIFKKQSLPLIKNITVTGTAMKWGYEVVLYFLLYNQRVNEYTFVFLLYTSVCIKTGASVSARLCV